MSFRLPQNRTDTSTRLKTNETQTTNKMYKHKCITTMKQIIVLDIHSAGTCRRESTAVDQIGPTPIFVMKYATIEVGGKVKPNIFIYIYKYIYICVYMFAVDDASLLLSYGTV